MLEAEMPLRITLVSPPPAVPFCIQRGKGEPFGRTKSAGEDISFDLTVRVKPALDGGPNFLGPFTQGPPSARFIYVNSGTFAGEPESCWSRRAKVPLGGITRAMIEEAQSLSAGFLEARIPGRAGDGGPICASVKLLDGGWKVVPRQAQA